jgi:hypothetical protein
LLFAALHESAVDVVDGEDGATIMKRQQASACVAAESIGWCLKQKAQALRVGGQLVKKPRLGTSARPGL